MFTDSLQATSTEFYMIAGFIVIFSVLLVYIASLWLRSRAMKQKITLLERFVADKRKR